jgi:hypothetical protein
VCRGGRADERKRRCRQIQGASQGAQQPGARRQRRGQQAGRGSNGDGRARNSCNCVRREVMERRLRVRWWRGLRVQEEVRCGTRTRTRTLGCTERHQLGSKEAALSAGIPQQWAARQANNAGLAVRRLLRAVRAVCPVGDN